MSMLEDELGDWRIRAITTLAEDFKHSAEKTFEEGSVVALESLTRDENENLLAFTPPSGPALALNISMNSAGRSKRLKDKIEYDTKKRRFGNGAVRILRKVMGQEIFYQYLEKSMVSIVFALQALEVFGNLQITEKVETPYELERDGEMKDFSEKELQRYCSVEEKLGTILPDILDTQTPKGIVVWENFKELVRVRNTIVHMKSRDTYTKNEIEEESLFYELLQHEVENFPKHAIEMIEYFYANGNEDRPRWFRGAWDKYNSTFR